LRKFVLASASPRRKELLAALIPEFAVIPSEADENLAISDPPHLVMRLSFDKADEIARTLTGGEVVIGADTVVVMEGRILGKPMDPADAARMLRALSGKTHTVYSGVTVIDTSNGERFSEYESTDVTFDDMTDDEIENYVNTGEPLDKAGAYGIQSYGARFIKKIDGCYFNVVGLPLNRLYHMLKNLGCY
jgi:septum formation protein